MEDDRRGTELVVGGQSRRNGEAQDRESDPISTPWVPCGSERRSRGKRGIEEDVQPVPHEVRLLGHARRSEEYERYACIFPGPSSYFERLVDLVPATLWLILSVFRFPLRCDRRNKTLL